MLGPEEGVGLGITEGGFGGGRGEGGDEELVEGGEDGEGGRVE